MALVNPRLQTLENLRRASTEKLLPQASNSFCEPLCKHVFRTNKTCGNDLWLITRIDGYGEAQTGQRKPDGFVVEFAGLDYNHLSTRSNDEISEYS